MSHTLVLSKKLDLTKKRAELKLLVKEFNPKRLIKRHYVYKEEWKYLYNELINLEERNLFNQLGCIFVLTWSRHQLKINTIHNSGARSIKVYKFKRGGSIDVFGDFILSFSSTYGLYAKMKPTIQEVNRIHPMASVTVEISFYTGDIK